MYVCWMIWALTAILTAHPLAAQSDTLTGLTSPDSTEFVVIGTIHGDHRLNERYSAET